MIIASNSSTFGLTLYKLVHLLKLAAWYNPEWHQKIILDPLLLLLSTKFTIEFSMSAIFFFRCIFLAGNGAFFINYIITAAFIGTALELLRFSELFMYLFHLCMTRSNAEKIAVRKVGGNVFIHFNECFQHW